MRRLAIAIGCVLVCVHAVAWAHDAKLQAELLDEVLRLTHAQVSEDVIIQQIRAWEFVFELNADDIVELRTLGVSDNVLEALIATANTVGADTGTRVVLTAGYYAPWYWYPIAWCGYYDPFPDLYCAYYYPFYYHCNSFGYYGWCGSTYYSHYEPGYQRRDGWRRREPKSPYTLASNLQSRRAGTITAPAATPAGRQTPRIIRGSTSGGGTETPLRWSRLQRTPEGLRAQPASGLSRSGRSARIPNVSRPRSGQLTPALRSGSAPLREARPATPTWRAPSSRGTTMSPPRTSSWSHFQAPSRAASMPRIQSMSRASSMPRSMPSAPAPRFGGRPR